MEQKSLANYYNIHALSLIIKMQNEEKIFNLIYYFCFKCEREPVFISRKITFTKYRL